MKTHRRIIIISLIASIVSFIFILFLKQDSKVFQIFMGLMGSALVTFLVEIPNYLSIKEENENKLYYSLLNIKIQIIVLEKSINDLINNNSIVSERMYDRTIQIISLYLNTLNGFDRNYYISESMKKCIQDKIVLINNTFSRFLQSSYLFDSVYLEKRIAVIEKTKKDRNIMANEMLDELNKLIEICEDYYKILNEAGNNCLLGKLKEQWENDEIKLKRNKSNSYYQ